MALHFLAEEAFDDLLIAWRHMHDLRSDPKATLRRKARARCQLEDARDRMRRLREALYPTAEEAEEVLVTALCSSLDEVMHLGWRHVHPHRPGNVVCLCGELIPIYK